MSKTDQNQDEDQNKQIDEGFEIQEPSKKRNGKASEKEPKKKEPKVKQPKKGGGKRGGKKDEDSENEQEQDINQDIKNQLDQQKVNDQDNNQNVEVKKKTRGKILPKVIIDSQSDNGFEVYKPELFESKQLKQDDEDFDFSDEKKQKKAENQKSKKVSLVAEKEKEVFDNEKNNKAVKKGGKVEQVQQKQPEESIKDDKKKKAPVKKGAEKEETKSNNKPVIKSKKIENTKQAGGGGGGKAQQESKYPIPTSEEILDYLKKQNRPFSQIVLQGNLHYGDKAQAKKSVLKILDDLVAEGEITQKDFGSSKIYLYNQSKIPEVDKQELENMQIQLQEQREEEKELNEAIKQLNQQLAGLNQQLTNDQLDAEILRMQNEIQKADKKLEVYRSGIFEKISDSDMKIVEDNKIKMEKEFKKRKRICKEAISQIAEGLEKKLAEVMEMLGIEQEEI